MDIGAVSCDRNMDINQLDWMLKKRSVFLLVTFWGMGKALCTLHQPRMVSKYSWNAKVMLVSCEVSSDNRITKTLRWPTRHINALRSKCTEALSQNNIQDGVSYFLALS